MCGIVDSKVLVFDFVVCFVFLKTGFFCVALTALELDL